MPWATRSRCTVPRCPHRRPCPIHQHTRTTPLAASSARGYDAEYKTERAIVLAGDPPCYWCGEAEATTADHVPSLATVSDRTQWTGILVPACRHCQNRHIPERDAPQPAS